MDAFHSPPAQLSLEQRFINIHTRAIDLASASSLEAVQQFVASLSPADIDAVHQVINNKFGGQPLKLNGKHHPITNTGAGSADYRTLTTDRPGWSLPSILFAALVGPACAAQRFLRPIAKLVKTYPSLAWPTIWSHLFEQYQQTQPREWRPEVASKACKACAKELAGIEGGEIQVNHQEERQRANSEESSTPSETAVDEQGASKGEEVELQSHDSPTSLSIQHTLPSPVPEQRFIDPRSPRTPNLFTPDEQTTDNNYSSDKANSHLETLTSAESDESGLAEAECQALRSESTDAVDQDEDLSFPTTEVPGDESGDPGETAMSKYLKRDPGPAAKRRRLGEEAPTTPFTLDDIRSVVRLFAMMHPRTVVLDPSNPATLTLDMQQSSRILLLPLQKLNPDALVSALYDPKHNYMSVFVSNADAGIGSQVKQEFVRALEQGLREHHPTLRPSIGESTSLVGTPIPAGEVDAELLSYILYGIHGRDSPGHRPDMIRRWISPLLRPQLDTPLVDLIVKGRITLKDDPMVQDDSAATAILVDLQKNLHVIQEFNLVLDHLTSFRRIVGRTLLSAPAQFLTSAPISGSPAFAASDTQSIIEKRMEGTQKLQRLALQLLVDETTCKDWMLQAKTIREACLETLKSRLESHELVKIQRETKCDVAEEDQDVQL